VTSYWEVAPVPGYRVAAPQDRAREGVRPHATGNEFRGIEYDVWRGTFRGFETNTGVE
jgi:hypothetical protein